MSSIFKTVLQMSITASYVIAVVIALRFLMRKFPKKYSYYLWSVVLFRLCCPFSFGSVLSIFNFSAKRGNDVIIDLSGVPVSQSLEEGVSGSIDLGSPLITEAVKESLTFHDTVQPIGTLPIESAQTPVIEQAKALSIVEVLSMIWVAGIVILIVYALLSYIRIRKELRFSVPLYDNVRQADIRSPFLFGLVKPRIYVPFDIDESALEMSLAHERYHLKRKDHWVRVLTYCLLCIHWINPLCWIAYYLMTKDMEMSCDEHVLSGVKDIRATYSDALLSLAMERGNRITAPITFGGVNVKERIKNAMRFKRTGKITSLFAALLCVLTLASCAFNGKIPSALDPTGSSGNISVTNPINYSSDMKRMTEGLAPQRVTTKDGIYYLTPREIREGDDLKLDGYNLIFVDYKTNRKSYLCKDPDCEHNNETCNAYVKEEYLLLTDAYKNCLYLLDPESGDLWKIGLDGKEKEKLLNLGGSFYVPYFDENTFQTTGNKLYISLKDKTSGEKKLFEIDVRERTSRSIYTLDTYHTVCGGFGDNLILQKEVEAYSYTDDDGNAIDPGVYAPRGKYQFGHLNVKTGEITDVVEEDLPFIFFVFNNNVMSMTYEAGKLFTHLLDLRTGQETVKEIEKVPEHLLSESNLTITYVNKLYAVDGTHFMLMYGEEEKGLKGAVAHICLVDALNGTAVSYDQLYKNSRLGIPANSSRFAETDSIFYLSSPNRTDPVLYMIGKEELLSGNVNSIGVVSDLGNTNVGAAEREGDILEQIKKNEAKLAEISNQVGKDKQKPGEQSLSWPLRSLMFVRRPDNLGLDFISSPGQEACAAFDGTVLETGFTEENGYYVLIAHGGGIMTAYVQLQSVSVKTGDDVSQGDVIGDIGGAVDISGAHLYFGVYSQGKQVDAVPFMMKPYRGTLEDMLSE